MWKLDQLEISKKETTDISTNSRTIQDRITG